MLVYFFADNLKPLFPGDSASELCLVVQWLNAKDIFQHVSFLCFRALSHQFSGTWYPFHFIALANLGRDHLRVDTKN